LKERGEFEQVLGQGEVALRLRRLALCTGQLEVVMRIQARALRVGTERCA